MLSQTTCRQCGEPNYFLTKRQTEVIKAFAARPGATNREIARLLSISVNTLKEHLRIIYRTVGAESRSECLIICLKTGIVERDECCTVKQQ